MAKTSATVPEQVTKTTSGDPRDRLLDVHEAAAMLAVKPATIYAWAHQRRIAVVKLGRNLLRFDPAELRRFIRQHRRPALQREHFIMTD